MFCFFFNHSLFKKEKLLAEGQFVFLELVPKDPRSLMQGDYMTLRYDISNNIPTDRIAKRGYCVVKLRENNVAKKIRIQENRTPLNEGEFLIKYSAREYRGINLGAESFFFQEGEGDKFAKTRSGGIVVDEVGNSVLVGLYDEDRVKIERYFSR